MGGLFVGLLFGLGFHPGVLLGLFGLLGGLFGLVAGRRARGALLGRERGGFLVLLGLGHRTGSSEKKRTDAPAGARKRSRTIDIDDHERCVFYTEPFDGRGHVY